MAEFCIDCENRMMGEEYEPIEPGDVVTDWDFCEGCGEWKECIVCFEPWYHGPRKKAPAREDGPGILARFRAGVVQLFEEARRRQKEPTDKQPPA